MIGTLELYSKAKKKSPRKPGPQGEVMAILAHDLRSPLPAGRLGKERISPKEGPLMFTGFTPVWKEEE